MTTAWLARGQISVITVKIGAHRVKIRLSGEKLAPLVKIPVAVKI